MSTMKNELLKTNCKGLKGSQIEQIKLMAMNLYKSKITKD